MHRTQEQVRRWHQAMGDEFPMPGEAPIDLTRNTKLRLDLLLEELQELGAALGYGLYDHVEGTALGWVPFPDTQPNTVDAIDALADLQFVLSGACDTWGIDLEPFFDEVTRSNMTKVGGPTRPDGKRLKPETYEPPRITTVLNLGPLNGASPVGPLCFDERHYLPCIAQCPVCQDECQ